MLIIFDWLFQTDDSWSDESAGREEEDWLLRKLTVAVQGEDRVVHFDPNLTESELLQLIDDALYGLPQAELQSRPEEYVHDYVSRLQRFVSSIDYFLDS